MRVIAKKTLRQFWGRRGHVDAQGPLEAWHDEALAASWRTPQDIKDLHANASFCGNNRVVFNIGGNKYRLVVEVQYAAQLVWVKFVGTHAQYDRIDVETVSDYECSTRWNGAHHGHQAHPQRRGSAPSLQTARSDLPCRCWNA